MNQMHSLFSDTVASNWDHITVLHYCHSPTAGYTHCCGTCFAVMYGETTRFIMCNVECLLSL